MKKTPKALDAIADVVLRYRPKPKSEPAKQRRKKRRKLEKRSAACEVCGTPTTPPMVRCESHLQRGDPWTD